MLKELKEIKNKEIKETKGRVSHQTENIHKEREIIKRNQMEIWN